MKHYMRNVANHTLVVYLMMGMQTLKVNLKEGMML